MKCYILNLFRYLVLIAGLFGNSLVHAQGWDGVVSGSIRTIDITGGTNYGFRITIQGVSQMCVGGQGWAYLNDVDSNYKAYVAALLMARAQNIKVLVHTRFEPSTAQCHIGYIGLLSD